MPSKPTMKLLITLLLLGMFASNGFAQKQIKIISIKANGKTILYAENKEACPVSLVLKLTLQNMVSNNGSDKVYVIPTNATHYKLAELQVIKRGVSGFSYRYKAYFGDVNQQQNDDNFEYDLPYKKGLQFTVNQGYNGSFSHKNENALDFDMPIGTEVLAAREGIVVDIVDTNIGACLDESCKTKANYVLLYHADGSFANYAHIQYHGAKVVVGDIVNKGDVIAFSGNTGFTKGPHLHFVCFLPQIDGRETLATKFKTGNGNKTEYLKEGNSYKRRYN
ncbi:MAG: M23 family metallopeptidase [Pedobacter sp.]|nr:M23 family metallopeptidase [Chitinophagaceae bacterium]